MTQAAQIAARDPRRFHIVTVYGLAGCGGQEINQATLTDADAVVPRNRCKRLGCKEYWP